jgi:hypothetical protein
VRAGVYVGVREHLPGGVAAVPVRMSAWTLFVIDPGCDRHELLRVMGETLTDDELAVLMDGFGWPAEAKVPSEWLEQRGPVEVPPSLWITPEALRR